jgi:Sushi repeat (SCR repeat)
MFKTCLMEKVLFFDFEWNTSQNQGILCLLILKILSDKQQSFQLYVSCVLFVTIRQDSALFDVSIPKCYIFFPVSENYILPDFLVLLCQFFSLSACLKAISCQSLIIINGQVNTTQVAYQTYANVSCQPGYELNVDQPWVVMWCLANASWSVLPKNCSRTYVHLCSFFLNQRILVKK